MGPLFNIGIILNAFHEFSSPQILRQHAIERGDDTMKDMIFSFEFMRSFECHQIKRAFYHTENAFVSS